MNSLTCFIGFIIFIISPMVWGAYTRKSKLTYMVNNKLSYNCHRCGYNGTPLAYQDTYDSIGFVCSKCGDVSDSSIDGKI